MFEEPIAEIRNQPGFQGFLLLPSKGDLRVASKSGPIAVINVSEYRCNAVLIKQQEVRTLALPALNSKEIGKKAQEGHLGSPEILQWLWDVALSPIPGALGFNKDPDNWPHVRRIPTGPLIKFQLHAAGCHAKGTSETILDMVMSSYSSSVKAIIHCRRLPITQVMSAPALFVAIVHTPGYSNLPFAAREVEVLQPHCESMKLIPVEPERCKTDILSCC